MLGPQADGWLLTDAECLNFSPLLCSIFSDDFFKVHKLKPNLKWRQAFEMYLKTMPPYYLLVSQSYVATLVLNTCLWPGFLLVSHTTNVQRLLPLWQPLKKALRMMGAPNLIADTIDCGLSYSVISYLKKLSQQVKKTPRSLNIISKLWYIDI